MSGNISFSNVPNVPQIDFDLSLVKVNSDYNIIFHYVYDPFNHFDTEFAFLKDPTLDKNTVVILWHPVEMGVWDQLWISKLNDIVTAAPYRLIYLTGCTSRLNLDQYFDIKIDVRFFPVFDIRAANLWEYVPDDVVLDKPNKFCCLNAKDLVHRRFIFSQLCNTGLFNNSTVSYRCTNWGVDFNPEFFYFFKGQGFTDEQLNEIKISSDSIVASLPVVIDDHNVVNNLPRDIFRNSYVNIINETDFINVPFSFNQSFVTEKTFNAIANNQLFIIVGHANSLQTVRDMGYRTFDGIIDESYDTIDNNGDRLMAVRDEILRFLNRPLATIREDYLRAQDIIAHNRDLLFSADLDQRLQHLIDTI